PARELVRGSALFGILYVLGQGGSIFSLARYSPAGILIGIGALVLLVTTWFVLPVGLNLLHHARPVPLPLVAPLLWVVGENARAFGDLAIPYIMLGHLLAPAPRLLQSADLVGAYGLSAWIVLANALTAWGIAHWRDRRRLAIAGAGLALALAAPIAYGAVRWAAVERRLAAAEK